MSSFEMELERKLEIPDPVTNAKVMDLLLEGVLSGFQKDQPLSGASSYPILRPAHTLVCHTGLDCTSS